MKFIYVLINKSIEKVDFFGLQNRVFSFFIFVFNLNEYHYLFNANAKLHKKNTEGIFAH